MKVLIVGAGGLGCVLAAHLAQAGHAVTLLARSATAAALQGGVWVEGIRTIHAYPQVATEPTRLEQPDLLLVAVKTRDTVAALAPVAYLRPETVASLQNGGVKNDLLSQTFGRSRVIGATTIIGATLLRPGVVQQTLDGETYFGELAPRPPASPRVQAIVDVFNSAGLYAGIPSSIESAEWSKLCQIVPAAVLSAASRLEYYRVCSSPDLASLFVEITREVAYVARRAGIRIEDYPNFNVRTLADAPFDDAVQMVIRRGRALEQRGLVNMKISMLQDLEQGRPTEIEDTAGFVVRRARELGIRLPATEFAYRLIRGIEGR